MSSDSDSDFDRILEEQGDPFEGLEVQGAEEAPEPEDDEPFRVVLPEAADFLVTPVPIYDLLMSAPMAPDTDTVWNFLCRTAKRQGTNSVWATNAYIAKGTKIGVSRVRAAKTWMAGHRLIGYNQGRSRQGKVGKGYTTILPTAGSPAGLRLVTPEGHGLASGEYPPEIVDEPQGRRLASGADAKTTASQPLARITGGGETGYLSALGDISSSSSCSEVSEKKEKEAEAVSLSFASRVRMTEAEHAELVAKHGPVVVAKAVEMLDAYKESHGAEYSSDAGALKSWAIDAARKRLAENGKAVPAKREPRRCPSCGVAITHNAAICLNCNAELPWMREAVAKHLQPQPPRHVDPSAPTREESREAAKALEGWRPRRDAQCEGGGV